MKGRVCRRRSSYSYYFLYSFADPSEMGQLNVILTFILSAAQAGWEDSFRH